MPFLAYAGPALASKWLAPKISIFVSLFCVYFLEILSLSFAQAYSVIEGVDYNFSYSVTFPWTHSFLASIFWSVIAMLVAEVIFIYKEVKNSPTKKISRASILGYSSVVGLLVFSNWLIDFIALPTSIWDRGLPLSVDGYETVGVGFASTAAGSIILELGVFVLGIAFYISYMKKDKTIPNLKSKIFNSKALQTHNPQLFKAFIAVFSFSFILLGIGLFFVISANLTDNNAYLYYPNFLDDKSANFLIQPNSISKQVIINVPESYMDKNLPVTINITVSSDSYFAENTPVQINATASYTQSTDSDIVIDSIYVEPIGSVTVYPNEYSAVGYSSYNYPCSLYLWNNEQQNISNFNQASDYCIFANSGPISFNLNFSISPKYGMWEKINDWHREKGTYFQDKYGVTIAPDTAEIKIQSPSLLKEQERSNLQSIANQRREALLVRLQTLQTAILAQQKANDENSYKINIGLTFVIMFLAVVEISFVLYEQSKDDERKETYCFRRELEKNKEIV